jgi:carbonic anhydrase
METIAMLERIIGGEKTLIITCMECCLDIEQRVSGQVYRFTAFGNMLNPQDKYQTQSILNFVEFKGCSKIIVAGHMDCRALKFILADDRNLALRGHSQLELKEILTSSHAHLLSDASKDRVLVEQNVITQCKALLGFAPIREKFTGRNISIIGIVLLPSGGCVQVFSNGISYNNILSMN